MTFIREEIKLRVVPKLNQAIDILSKLRSRASLNILKMTYPLFCSLLLYRPQLWGQSVITSQNRIQKLQNRALGKILFKKQQDFIYQVYKELKILKLCNRLLYLQNCLFMSEIETNQRLVNSIVDFNTLQWQPQLYYINSKQKIFLLIHKSM